MPSLTTGANVSSERPTIEDTVRQQNSFSRHLNNLQGSALSPASYMLIQSQLQQLEQVLSIAQGEDDLSTTSSLSSQDTTEVQSVPMQGNATQDQQEASMSTSFDNLDSYYGHQTLITDYLQVRPLDGDTAASSGSYMSRVEVQRVDDGGRPILQLEGHILEIPIRELDDPPDTEGMDAASLDYDSEIEPSGIR
jgi:hypothetical protein